MLFAHGFEVRTDDGEVDILECPHRLEFNHDFILDEQIESMPSNFSAMVKHRVHCWR